MQRFFRSGKKPADRHKEFSVHQSWRGCEFDIHSVDTLKELLAKRTPNRYQPLVALLRSALRHRVMIIADGKEWQRTHETINPALRAAALASDYGPLIVAVAEAAFANISPSSKGSSLPAAPIEIVVEPLMRKITLSILGHLLFGGALHLDEAEYLEATLTRATEGVRRGIHPWINAGLGAVFNALHVVRHQPVFLPKAQRKAMGEILRWIGGAIDEIDRRGPTAPRPPLLAGLESRYSELSASERRRCIAAEFAMMFIAGIETTASALTMAIAEIARDPTVREFVTREARQQPDPESAGRAPSAAVRFPSIQYPYIHCVFRETLRRHTIVPTFLRETEKEYEVCPVTAQTESTSPQAITPESRDAVRIPPGSTLRYLPVQGHMRRGVWTDPHRFDPSRFARPLNAEQTRNYIPFGFGPQRCPGHAIATAESILILATFFKNFDVEVRDARRAIAMERNAVFTNRPVGITVRVSRASATA